MTKVLCVVIPLNFMTLAERVQQDVRTQLAHPSLIMDVKLSRGGITSILATYLEMMRNKEIVFADGSPIEIPSKKRVFDVAELEDRRSHRDKVLDALARLENLDIEDGD